MYRLGIDVGGTNTDAIILDDQQHVINSVKRHTTKDIQTGISNAIQAVLADQALDLDQISKAMLGTTRSRMRLLSASILPVSASCG